MDNGSEDQSVKMVRSDFPDVKIIESKKNLGYAGGCNLGAAAAASPYLLFLNNDTVQHPDWLSPLVETMETDPDISSVQPRIRNYNQQEYFDYAGAAGGKMDILVFPFARGRIFDTVEKDEGQYDDRREIFWASGTAFITRREVFEEIGGFDESMFAHMEEIDYHWRCRLAGYRVLVEPESIVLHHGATTLPPSSPFKTYLNHRNSLLLLLTNYNPINSVFLLIPRMLLQVISLIKDLVEFKFDHAGAQIKAIFWLMVNPSVILSRRRKTRQIRQVEDHEIMLSMFSGSIVWEYYIRKRRTYTQLSASIRRKHR